MVRENHGNKGRPTREENSCMPGFHSLRCNRICSLGPVYTLLHFSVVLRGEKFRLPLSPEHHHSPPPFFSFHQRERDVSVWYTYTTEAEFVRRWSRGEGKEGKANLEMKCQQGMTTKWHCCASEPHLAAGGKIRDARRWNARLK